MGEEETQRNQAGGGGVRGEGVNQAGRQAMGRHMALSRRSSRLDVTMPL